MLPGVGCVPVRYCTAQNMAKVINDSDSSMANSSSGVNPGGQKEPDTEQCANDSLRSSPPTSSGADPDSRQGEQSRKSNVDRSRGSGEGSKNWLSEAAKSLRSLKSIKLLWSSKDGGSVKTLKCKDCDAQHLIPLTDNVRNLMEFRCEDCSARIRDNMNSHHVVCSRCGGLMYAASLNEHLDPSTPLCKRCLGDDSAVPEVPVSSAKELPTLEL